MHGTGGRELVERLEELANRFRPPSGAMVTVSLTADDAQQVHEGLIAAAAHVAQVLRPGAPWAGLAQGLATQLLFADTIATVECELQENLLHLPAGPGLGVEIDEEALERHRIRP